MSALSSVAKVAGGAAVLAAGAAIGVLAEHRTVARLRSGEVDAKADDEGGLGTLRGIRRTVIADDGLELYVEVDEPEGARPEAAPTIIFVHGLALNLDYWHFQRLALRGRHRLVFYDQRSHGRSGRSRAEHSTVDQLGQDLANVIDAVADDGPVVLVGHSMGGMTILALAEQHPEWIGARVVGVALLCTSAGEVGSGALGLSGASDRVMRWLVPSTMATLARAPRLVERGRRAGSDLGFVVTRRLAFGGPVPDEYVDFTDEMLSATPIEVIADFFPGFEEYQRYDALPSLGCAPTLVIGGTSDSVTPIEHMRMIAEALPSAEVLELDGAGHLANIERHDEVNAALQRLIEKAVAHG